MDRFFAPRSLAIYGLSRRPGNTARVIVDNCRRWGFRGPIVGINPRPRAMAATTSTSVRAPQICPFRPTWRCCSSRPGRCRPRWRTAAAPVSAGWPSGRRLQRVERGRPPTGRAGARRARRHAIRFVGPNGLALADTTSGLCLPFVPALPVRPGSFSFISQSGGLGLFLWNLLESEQLGLAQFASIGNRLDLDEVDFLEFLGADPATRVIGLYLESIADGRRLIEAAARAGKPVIVYKANTTDGGRAAMSHTASLGGDDRVVDAAFARAGIIRIHRFRDFVTTARAFDLPPMRGRRIMLMSPAGGLGVAMADRSERRGFAFADPGEPFYRELATIVNAGIIRPGNPWTWATSTRWTVTRPCSKGCWPATGWTGRSLPASGRGCLPARTCSPGCSPPTSTRPRPRWRAGRTSRWPWPCTVTRRPWPNSRSGCPCRCSPDRRRPGRARGGRCAITSSKRPRPLPRTRFRRWTGRRPRPGWPGATARWARKRWRWWPAAALPGWVRPWPAPLRRRADWPRPWAARWCSRWWRPSCCTRPRWAGCSWASTRRRRRNGALRPSVRTSPVTGRRRNSPACASPPWPRRGTTCSSAGCRIGVRAGGGVRFRWRIRGAVR